MRDKPTAMKVILSLLVVTLMLSFGSRAQVHQASSIISYKTQSEVVLPIKDYGKVFHVPFASDRPDPTMQYRIVFEISGEAYDSAHLYPPLEYLARMYNLHYYGGVPQKNLDVVLVIGGVAIPAIMTNESYRKKYGVDNPNLKILQQLKDAGIKINGCAQSTLKNGIDPYKEVNPDITLIFSRFTTVSMYQLKGYSYFKF